MTERRLKGRYELGSVLGRGAATTTHLAHDHETGERCVVKVLSLASEDALKAHELLTREARVLQRLDHPRIPRLVDFFSEEDGRDTRVCLVQQHVAGKSLEDSVRGVGAWDEKETLALGAKLARVLEYLHGFEPPILHRDVKPGNVIVTPGDRVYLVDFGAVRDHLPAELLHPSGATIVGTRGYMPIEQFEGHAVPGSDLYSLGATLVFALSGKEPAELGKRGMRLDFERHVSVSPGFARLLARLLEPDWRERPLSATELREELERLATQAAPAGPRPARRRPGPWIGLALVLLLGAVGVAILARSRQPPETRPMALSVAAPPAAVEEPPSPVMRAWQGLLARSGRKDSQGDELPQYALRRLGTVRLRHGAPVRGVAFTPDGASLVSASADGSVSVWSAVTGEERRRLELDEAATSLAMAPDGSRMLVGTERLWTARLVGIDGRDVARLLPVPSTTTSNPAVSEVAWSGNGALVATRTQETVDVWHAKDGRHRRRLAPCGAGRGLAFVRDGGTLLVACPADTRLVDVATGSETRLELRNSYTPLAVSSDGRLVVTGSGNIRLVDLAGQAPERRFGDAELGSASTFSLCLSYDASLVVAGLTSGKLVVWDVATGARRRVFEGHIGNVTAAAVSRDGRWLASGGEDGQVRLFDLASGAALGVASPHRAAVNSLDFMPGTGEVLSAGQDGQLSRWNRAGAATTMRSFERPALAVFTVSDSRIAVVEPQRVHVLDVASGWEVSSFPLPARSFRSGVALNQARGLLAAGGASSLEIVELSSGARRAFPVPAQEEALAFSPDGAIVATLRETDESRRLGSGRLLVFRDSATGRELAKQPHWNGGPDGFACRSHDGSYFGFNSGVWRLKSVPKLLMENLGWLGGANECAVSPDARFVALTRTRSETSEIEVREQVRSSSGHPELKPIGRLRGHRGAVTSLAFAPGSHTLVSGGADTSILVWDLASLASPPEARQRAASHTAPRLLLTFEDGISGPGITPVRLPSEAPFAFVPGRVGSALQRHRGLVFPETRELVLGDEFTLTTFFRVEAAALGAGVEQVVGSDLVSLDVRDGGKGYLFFHFLERGGHASAELAPWLGPSGKIEAGRWYHVGVTYRRSQQATRICVDGVCAPGPQSLRFSDRVGELQLGRGYEQSENVAIDELAVFDRALADDEIAHRAGLTKAAALPTPGPLSPTALPRLPAEQEPLPREGLPEGKDVTQHVSVEEKPGFRVYRFGGPLARAQTLDVDVGLGAVWVGTSLGLLRHDLRGGGFRQWDETAGLPGERLNEIAVVGGRVIADSYRPTGPGSITGTGALSFDFGTLAWTPLKGVGGVWDLWGDGSTLWVGTGQGAEARDLQTGTVRRFTREAGELVDNTVHCVRRHGETVAFGALGDYVSETKDFKGGGLTLWDRRSNRFTSYTLKDGLARAYSCDVFLDDAEVFVAHWGEERGLTRIDRRTGRVEAMRQSANGLEIGGVLLAGEPATLWIGQQGALVRLDRASRKATALYEKDGLPGYIVSGIAVAEDAVWASLYSYGQDGVRSAGLVRFPRR